MAKKYQNPPVEEALCGFRFSSDTKWDITVPGLVYERLKAHYPVREPRLYHELEVVQESEGFQQKMHTSERIMLFTEDRRQFVQVGRLLMAVHVLRPYPTWMEFKPKIELAWRSLCEVVNVSGLEQINLRYINRIEFPKPDTKLEEYLEFYPYLGSRLPQQTTGFQTIVEFEYEDGRDRCRVILVPESKQAKNTLFLDIDYYLARPRAISVETALDWVENAHGCVETIFEGCITDVLREHFGLLEG